MPSNTHITMALKPETLRPTFMNKLKEISMDAPDGAEIRFNYQHPYDSKFAKVEDSVIIDRLPITALMSDQKINSFATGKVEEFAAKIGLFETEDPTVALWVQILGTTFSFEFVYGGNDIEILFPMSKWMGSHGRDQGCPETLISARQISSSIRFKKKNNVSDWVLIQEK